MPAMIWDSTSQAFKEAENPKIYKDTANAFVDSDGMVHNGAAQVEAYSAGLPGTSIVVGQDYTLGSGAQGYRGNITARCLSKSSTTAILHTYGVAYEGWPGAGLLDSKYASNWGSLGSAISDVKLPEGTITYDSYSETYSLFESSINTPPGSLSVLRSIRDQYHVTSWLRNEGWYGNKSTYGPYFIYQDPTSDYRCLNTNYYQMSYNVAPYFTLDLTKVKIQKDNTIIIA